MSTIRKVRAVLECATTSDWFALTALGFGFGLLMLGWAMLS